ncbi:MAG: aminotransferase class IV [Desulfobacterales bacterium]
MTIDGKTVAESEAVISIRDLAVLRGYGVFDFLRTYGKRPFHLEDHVKRLERSARLIGMTLKWSRRDIIHIVEDALSKSSHGECNIRILVTGGGSDDSITPMDAPRLIVMITPLHELPREWYAHGVKVITSHIDRFVPGAKSTNYIPGILALKDAREQGAVESLYVDGMGRVLEGTTSNFFGFVGETLVTPDTGILPGITRQVVINLVRGDIPLEVRDLHANELMLMDEAFITASNKEIVPVVRINAIRLGDGAPGARTLDIMKRFADYTTTHGG